MTIKYELTPNMTFKGLLAFCGISGLTVKLAAVKSNIETQNEDEALPPIQPYWKFLYKMGRSRSSGWRYARRGWIKITVLAGKPYVTAGSIREFLRRAEAGEFAKMAPGSQNRGKA
jgi:hypothetical protein